MESNNHQSQVELTFFYYKPVIKGLKVQINWYFYILNVSHKDYIS